MSSYDAYNLSLRDSTEFTVPTGGSGGDSQIDVVDVTINVNGSADGLFDVIRYGSFLVEDDMLENYYNTNKIISRLPAVQPSSIINAHVVIPHNGVTFVELQSNSLYLVSDVSVTGDVELMNEEGIVVIRGPGTLTLTITHDTHDGEVINPSDPGQ